MTKKDFEKIISASSFLGYYEKKNPEYEVSMELQNLFPIKPVMGLDYSFIKSSNGAVELTSPSAYDAEPIVQNREGFDALSGELPLFRKKMVLSEKEKAMILNISSNGSLTEIARALEQVYDDEMKLINGAKMTMEYLRAKALFDGKITMASKGGAVNIDYKVPAGHKATLSGTDAWDDASATILDDIKDWADTIEEDTGIRPNTLMLNRNTYKLFRSNTQVRNNLIPLSLVASATVSANVAITDVQIDSSIQAYCGIDKIVVYNRKVTLDKTILDLVEDNKVAMFYDGDILGNTMVGVSPAEQDASRISDAGGDVAVTSEGIAINTYVSQRAPYRVGTEVEFIGVPSFPMADFVFQATVA